MIVPNSSFQLYLDWSKLFLLMIQLVWGYSICLHVSHFLSFAIKVSSLSVLTIQTLSLLHQKKIETCFGNHVKLMHYFSAVNCTFQIYGEIIC